MDMLQIFAMLFSNNLSGNVELSKRKMSKMINQVDFYVV